MPKNGKTDKKFCVAVFAWFLFSWSWVLVTDSVTLSGSRITGLVVGSIVLVINSLISCVVIVKFFAYLSRRLEKTKTYLVLPILLSVFAFADFLVAWLTTIIWIGPQGSIDNVLPLSSPALLLVNTPLGYAARFFGFYGLAAFLWTTVFLVINKKYMKLMAPFLAVLIVSSVFGWLLYRSPNGQLISVKLVNETLSDRVSSIDGKNTDLVVFPEYGFDEINNENLNQRINTDNYEKTVFVGSRQITLEQGHLNQMVFGDTQKGIIGTQDKHRLIPGGEDLSYMARVGLVLTGQRGTLDFFTVQREVKKNPKPLQPVWVSDSLVLGSAVCSSIISPEDYRKLSNDGANVLTNSASLNIFNGSRVFSWQQKLLGMFMAKANARYFLQSANSGSTHVIDHQGSVVSAVDSKGVLEGEAHTNTRKTPYTLFGEWLAFTGFLVILYSMIVRLIVKTKHRVYNNSNAKLT